MCRLLATVSQSTENATWELLNAPHSLKRQAEYARMPRGFGGHSDGCGIAWSQPEEVRMLKRGKLDRWDPSFCDEVAHIRPYAYIAHNRASSPGLKVTSEESHPYLTEWNGIPMYFCHNGDIATFMDDAISEGITDSRLFMRHFASHVQDLSVESIGEYLRDVSAAWTYSSLNALVLTADGIYAWRWYDEALSRSFDPDRYFSLYISQNPQKTLIASEPVDDSTTWTAIPNKTVVSVKRSATSVVVEQRRYT